MASCPGKVGYPVGLKFVLLMEGSGHSFRILCSGGLHILVGNLHLLDEYKLNENNYNKSGECSTQLKLFSLKEYFLLNNMFF